MKKLICHITTVHSANDTRIYVKECHSLSESGYKVFLIAPESFTPIKNSPIQINFIPRERNRFLRLIRGQWRAFKKACKIKADLYHFHDPELIPLGLILKIMGKKVIYDVHEDLPRQILTKNWLPLWSRKIIATIAEFVEWIGTKFFDGIITVTPLIQKRFPPHKTILVCNFPILGELKQASTNNYAERPPYFAYIGGVTAIRGIREMVKALEFSKYSNMKLIIGGLFDSEKLFQEVKMYKGWEKVKYEGFMARERVSDVLRNVRAGLMVSHPTINYKDAYPTKLFEYMSSGIPVIVSNFPFLSQLIKRTKSGINVNPLDPQEIAEAMEWILKHPNEAEKMGENGLKAVQSIYNWEKENEKLLAFYKKLLGEGA